MNKKFRLNRSKDIQRVRDLGKSIAHPLLVIVFIANQLEHSRIGVSTSKRVGGAVQRNRAKRLIREGISPLINNLNSNLDLVIIARKPILKSKMQNVEKALAQTLNRGKMLKNE